MAKTLPIRKGTKAAYNALSAKDARTIYILTDVTSGNNMFLGVIPIGKGGLSDAPSDGKLYGRCNGEWVEINETPAEIPTDPPTTTPTSAPEPPTPTPDPPSSTPTPSGGGVLGDNV